jgi:hypothetical protein
MVTGQTPFPGDTPLSAAARRLAEPPRSPRAHRPDLDPRWEAAILRCLARNPRDRYAQPEEAWRALAGKPPPVSRRAWLGALALALGIGALAALLTPPRRPDPAPPAVRPRRAIAILGFKNLSGKPEAAWLSTALAEMMGTELAAGGALRAVPGETVARVKLDLALADADSLAGGTLGRMRALLGADLIVLGSYLALDAEGGGRLRLDLRLQDTAAGSGWACSPSPARRPEPYAAPCRAVRWRRGCTPRGWRGCGPSTRWARAGAWSGRWRRSPRTRRPTPRWRSRCSRSASRTRRAPRRAGPSTCRRARGARSAC